MLMSKKAFKKSENTQTHTAADATRLIELGKDEITQLRGKIVPLLQVISGPEQGRIIKLSEYTEFSIGRSQSCELTIADTSCSRRHAVLTVNSNESVKLEDLGSTNGSKVNGVRINEPVDLQDGDMLQLGDHTRVKFSLSLEQDAELQMDVFHRATRDPLTGAYNRRSFEESFDRELAFINRGQANGRGLGLIIFDVDHFKKVNDTFGHAAGDAVLKEIGMRVPELVRREDVFARIGGEEFVVLTRNETPDELRVLAERIRVDFEKLVVHHGDQELKFTVSVGVSYQSPTQGTLTKEELIEIADKALYEAKQSGRNKVCVKSPLKAV